MKLYTIAILLFSSHACLAQGSRGTAARASVLKDSSAVAIIAEFRRDIDMFRSGPELIKSAQRAGQSAKADAFADSLANIFIASELARKTRQPSMRESQFASQALLALSLSGSGDQPYSGAADRLITNFNFWLDGGGHSGIPTFTQWRWNGTSWPFVLF